jgi:hypothetical protein
MPSRVRECSIGRSGCLASVDVEPRGFWTEEGRAVDLGELCLSLVLDRVAVLGPAVGGGERLRLCRPTLERVAVLLGPAVGGRR